MGNNPAFDGNWVTQAEHLGSNDHEPSKLHAEAYQYGSSKNAVRQQDSSTGPGQTDNTGGRSAQQQLAADLQQLNQKQTGDMLANLPQNDLNAILQTLPGKNSNPPSTAADSMANYLQQNPNATVQDVANAMISQVQQGDLINAIVASGVQPSDLQNSLNKAMQAAPGDFQTSGSSNSGTAGGSDNTNPGPGSASNGSTGGDNTGNGSGSGTAGGGAGTDSGSGSSGQTVAQDRQFAQVLSQGSANDLASLATFLPQVDQSGNDFKNFIGALPQKDQQSISSVLSNQNATQSDVAGALAKLPQQDLLNAFAQLPDADVQGALKAYEAANKNGGNAKDGSGGANGANGSGQGSGSGAGSDGSSAGGSNSGASGNASDKGGFPTGLAIGGTVAAAAGLWAFKHRSAIADRVGGLNGKAGDILAKRKGAAAAGEGEATGTTEGAAAKTTGEAAAKTTGEAVSKVVPDAAAGTGLNISAVDSRLGAMAPDLGNIGETMLAQSRARALTTNLKNLGISDSELTSTAGQLKSAFKPTNMMADGWTADTTDMIANWNKMLLNPEKALTVPQIQKLSLKSIGTDLLEGVEKDPLGTLGKVAVEEPIK